MSKRTRDDKNDTKAAMAQANDSKWIKKKSQKIDTFTPTMSSAATAAAAAATAPTPSPAATNDAIAANAAAPEAKFHSVTMKGNIKPPLRFMPITTIPQPQALYIKAFDEIFSQISNENERKAILNNIEAMIANGLICFIDFTGESVEEEALRQTAVVLGENSCTVKCIQKQREDFFELIDFKELCKQRGLETVYMGGVFGDACVRNAAVKMAVNIYAKRPGDFHPNIRFINEEYPFRFKHAVIWPDITEGYFQNNQVFRHFFHFPQTAAFTVKLGDEDIDEKAKEKLIAKKPQATGQSYNAFTEVEDPEKHMALCKELHRTAYLRTCLFTFFQQHPQIGIPADLIENIAEHLVSPKNLS